LSYRRLFKFGAAISLMHFSLFGNSRWDIGKVTAPWGDRPSVYRHIVAHIRPGEPGLSEGGETLPDDRFVRGDVGFGWAPGALDGALGRHFGGGNAADAPQEILDALRALLDKATDERAAELYSLLVGRSALDYVDPLLEAVVRDERLDPERLHAVARWLAAEAPDREPVKTAIALLGVLRGGQDRDLLLTLGRHEEFTLYAAVALRNAEEDAELSLWALGTLVTGWGRIQIVERLAGTRDEQIRAWMLREGYRNDIMDEYTALTCARTGDLLGALRRPDPDERLLKGAGSILGTLIRGRGGPAEGIESYPEGAEAAELYLRHLQARELDLEDFVAVTTIEQFLGEEGGEAHDPTLGWPQRRAVLSELTAAIRSPPGWEERVRAGLASEDRQAFWVATEAAKALGMDLWDVYFERLDRGEDHWYFVMQTDDPERIDRVVRLAEERLPLDEIAAGPSDALGLGPEFQAHGALDFVLQDLRRFPGKGWPLVRAGLQSPVTRNRNMAVRALGAWGRENWPEEAEPFLKRALEVEPNEETRETMRRVLAGEPSGYES
jgi:hypothetical protein